eukprot:169463-Pyramimonas_sp.AAC.1
MDIFATCSRSGGGMAVAARRVEEYDILLDKYMAMDVKGEEALYPAKKELAEQEEELDEMGDYKTASNMGGETGK